MMKTTKLFVKILMILTAMSSGTGFAQQSSDEKIIRGYYAAYEKKDWSSMERLLADAFTFSSPVDDHINLKAYKERCWPNCYKIKRFDVVKLIVNGDDGFVTYNGWTTDGKLFRNTEYFKFKDGKIKENESFFGPGVNYPNNKEKKGR
jgi:ketosteroid isomerase-like protein